MARKKSLICNNWFTLMVLLLAPAVILLAAWGVVKIRNQGLDGNLYRTLDAEVVWVGGDYVANLHFVGGEVTEAGPRLETSDADVMVLLDRSSSMGSPDEPTSSLSEGVSATVRLCRLLGAAGARVGLMTFDHESQLVSGLTDDANEILKAARQVQTGGGTEIGSAIFDAIGNITSDTSTVGREPFVVVISDFGDADLNMGDSAVAKAQDLGIQAIGIGVGTFINEDYLFNIFAPPSQALLCVEASDLDVVFNNLVASSGMLSVSATECHVTEKFDPRDFEVVEAVDEIPYLLHADLSEGVLEFYSQRLFGTINTFDYLVCPRTIGIQRLALEPAVGAMTDSVGAPAEAKSDVRPYVLALSWWLLLLLWLPALIFLFLMISRVSVKIYEPQPRAPFQRQPDLQTLMRRKVPEMEPIPTLFVGLGGIGCQALLHVKHVVSEWFEEPEKVLFTYLGLDTARQNDPHPPFCDQVLQDGEKLTFPSDDNLMAYIEEIYDRPPNAPDGIGVWAGIAELQGGGDQAVDVSGGTKGNRRLGRLAFLRDLASEKSRIVQLRNRVTDWAHAHYCAGVDPVVIIAGSGYGGTSSGVVIDVARVVREGLRSAWVKSENKGVNAAADDTSGANSETPERSLIQESSPVYLYLTHHGLDAQAQGDAANDAMRNAEALLVELERFQVGSLHPASTPEVSEGNGTGISQISRPLFDRIHIMEPNSTVAEMADSMFHYCERSLSSALINSIDDSQWRIHTDQREDGRMRVNLPAIATLRFPRGRIVNRLVVRAVNELFESQLVGWEFDDALSGDAVVDFLTRTDCSSQEIIAEWKGIRSRMGDDRLSSAEDTSDPLAFYRLLAAIANDPHAELSDSANLPAVEVIKTRFARDLTEWLRVDPLIEDFETTVNRVGKLGDLQRILRLLDTHLRQALEGPALADAPDDLSVLKNVRSVIDKTVASLEFWRRLLLCNNVAETKEPLAKPEIGLAVYLARRLGELKSQDKILRNLTPRRVYLLGGDECAHTARRDTLYQRYLKEPLLSHAQLARQFQWRFDSGLSLALDFGFGPSRSLTLKSSSKGGAAREGAVSLWSTLREFIMSHRECRGMRQVSLADACPEDGPDMSGAITDAEAQQLHVLYSYPDVTEWPELTDVEERLRAEVVGGIAYERALTNNPLMISVHYTAPDRLWYRNPAAGQAGMDWLPRSVNADTLKLPFVQLAEARAANLCHVYAQTKHQRPDYFAAPCRALAEHYDALTQVVCLDALGHIQCSADNALVRAWRLEIDGRLINLNRRNEHGWLQALHQLVMTGRGAEGEDLQGALDEARVSWANKPANERLDVLETYINSGQPRDPNDSHTWEMLQAVAMVEIQVIKQQVGGRP